MWLLLVLLLLEANPAPRQTSPNPSDAPTLIVQVVDPGWFPISGAEVTLKSLNGTAHSSSKLTDKDGYAKFSAPADADYTIEAEHGGLKKGRLKRFHLFKGSDLFPTAYVQLQLHFSGPGTMVY